MQAKNEIYALLRELGITAKYRGYLLSADAVCLVMDDEEFLHSLTTRLYPTVAQHFHLDNCTRVERNIRTVIDNIWARERGRKRLEQISSNVLGDEKPTVGMFIEVLAVYLMKHKDGNGLQPTT